MFKGIALFWAALLVALLLTVVYPIWTLRAIKVSRDMGLKAVVLLPIHNPFKALYSLLAGGNIESKRLKAYEIHLMGRDLSQLRDDLNYIRTNMDGLFFWETSAPVPSGIRRLIRYLEKNKKAFWLKGPWPLPRMPFSAMDMDKKRVRRGAILIEKGEFYE